MKILPIVSESPNIVMEDGKQLMLCPICKSENTHLEYSAKVTVAENYLVGDRGGGLTIPMWCESGHFWDLVLSHHKGTSFVTTTNFKEAINPI